MQLALVLDAIVDVQVNSNEDQLGDHEDVLLVAVDLGDVQLLENVSDVLCLRGRHEKCLDWAVQ